MIFREPGSIAYYCQAHGISKRWLFFRYYTAVQGWGRAEAWEMARRMVVRYAEAPPEASPASST